MLELSTTAKYRKDRKLMRKRGLDLSLLDVVIKKLQSKEKLASSYRDHSLINDYSGFRECHIAPDWLLIYAVDDKNLILTAVRTGSHSDLF
jgi:mRNA interferase YafQ